jgi:uncharacterized protein YbjT (DUF2867 family)
MILVTGATGNIGRLVVDELLAKGATDIRALTNKPEKAALPPEVEVVRGYLGRVESLEGVFDGVEKMYLAPLESTVREVTAMAAKAGVRHIVDVSGPKDSWWAPVATAVEESGAAWTHLSPGEFMDNMLVWAEQIRTTGEVREGYPNAANAPIDLGDIAAVAAAVLLEDGHAGKEYLLTGPETLTRAEMVRHIGAALGREVPVVEVDHEEAVAVLEPAMGEFARWYVDSMRDYADLPQPANQLVEELTGRPATTFAEWARKKVDEFR